MTHIIYLMDKSEITTTAVIYLSSSLGSSCSQTVKSNVTSCECFFVVAQAVKVNYFFFLRMTKNHLKIYFYNFTKNIYYTVNTEQIKISFRYLLTLGL